MRPSGIRIWSLAESDQITQLRNEFERSVRVLAERAVVLRHLIRAAKGVAHRRAHSSAPAKPVSASLSSMRSSFRTLPGYRGGSPPTEPSPGSRALRAASLTASGSGAVGFVPSTQYWSNRASGS